MDPEGVATGLINQGFPWFSSVYNTCSVGTELHCAPLRPPTATILHSAGCKVLLPALSTDNNCQLLSSGSLQTLPLPIVSPSTFLSDLLFVQRAFTGRTTRYWTAQSVQCLATGWAKEQSEFSSH